MLSRGAMNLDQKSFLSNYEKAVSKYFMEAKHLERVTKIFIKYKIGFEEIEKEVEMFAVVTRHQGV